MAVRSILSPIILDRYGPMAEPIHTPKASLNKKVQFIFTPKSIVKPIKELLAIEELEYVKLPTKLPKGLSSEEALIERINKLEKVMWECDKRWEYEKAAKLRDEIKQLREL